MDQMIQRRCLPQQPASLRHIADVCRAYAEGASKAVLRETLIEIGQIYDSLASEAATSGARA